MEIRDKDGNIIGYRCDTCDRIVSVMWGETCNQCRELADFRAEQLKAIRGKKNEKERETLLDNYDKKIIKQEKEIAKLKEEVRIFKESADFWEKALFRESKRRKELKEELAIANEALRISCKTLSEDNDFPADPRKLKEEFLEQAKEKVNEV